MPAADRRPLFPETRATGVRPRGAQVRALAGRSDWPASSSKQIHAQVSAASLASGMWRQAADAWYARDRTAAAVLGEHDREMDGLHASLTAELASGQMTIPVTMEMTLVARCCERLGAHAVNIARRVAYLAGPTADCT